LVFRLPPPFWGAPSLYGSDGPGRDSGFLGGGSGSLRAGAGVGGALIRPGGRGEGLSYSSYDSFWVQNKVDN